MSFPKYPEYKNSGVEWLGGIPKGWQVNRTKNIFEIKKRISGAEGYEVLSITQQGIKIKDIESGDGQLSMDYSKYQFVEVGDFAMNQMDLLTGFIDISNIFGVTSPDYRVFSVKNNEKSYDRYFLYLFQMCYRKKIFYAFGQGASQLGRWRLPTEQFNDFVLPYPSYGEQKVIASFLDSETAKIDALISEQQKLIELLKENRLAVISHAVTKGLDPNAKMKDSGIEWLGMVPEGWEVLSIRHCLEQVFNGITTEQIDESDDTFPVTRIETISYGVIDRERVGYISKNDARDDRKLVPGDILFSNINSLSMIGNCAIYNGEFELYAGMNLLVLRPENIINSKWLFWLIRSTIFRQVVESLAKPAINQASISQTSLSSIYIPLPPETEQALIAEYVDSQVEKFDDLAVKAQDAIDLLQERRTALISAAITGKIDVRENGL
jgi:type I restriction enzyme S subunit